LLIHDGITGSAILRKSSPPRPTQAREKTTVQVPSRRWGSGFRQESARSIRKGLTPGRGIIGCNRVTFSRTKPACRRRPSALGKTWNQFPEELSNTANCSPRRWRMMLATGGTIFAVRRDRFAATSATERQRLKAGTTIAESQRVQRGTAPTKDGIRHGRNTILNDKSILVQRTAYPSTGDRPCPSESCFVIGKRKKSVGPVGIEVRLQVLHPACRQSDENRHLPPIPGHEEFGPAFFNGGDGLMLEKHPTPSTQGGSPDGPNPGVTLGGLLLHHAFNGDL